jgi:VCBS repeat protein
MMSSVRPKLRRWISGLGLLLAGATARAGTLDSWAADLAAKVPARGDVAVAVRPRDPALARLSETLEGLLVARVARASAARPDAEAARRAGFDELVSIELVAEQGEIVATCRVIAIDGGFWHPAPPALASTLVSRVKVDPELRAYLGGGPATAPRRDRRMSFRALKTPLDLGAPILALAAGVAPGELLALTTGEVVTLRLDADGATVTARRALEGATPVPRPRTPIGTLAVVGGLVAARSSEHGAADFPLCDGRSAALVGSTAVLSDLSAKFLAAGCGDSLFATVDAGGTLRLTRPGQRNAWSVINGVGTAFAIADIDGDGQVEVVASAWRAPGTGDVLTVYRVAADGAAKPARRGTPVAGGVAGIAAGDFDGDGAIDAVAAVQAGNGRYELWLLE